VTPESTASKTNTDAFGIALKRARRAARLTQAELAERAGFSVVYISMLERGARAPQRSTVTLLTDALDLSGAERSALESAAQAPDVARRRHHGAMVTDLVAGAYLGALPASSVVGRERELGVIEHALAAVASGQGRLLLLIGEPGVGKTRLAQEITIRARARGLRVLTGRCYEPQQNVAYYPFLEALAMAAADADSLAQAHLPERWPEVARLLPDHEPTAHAPAHLDDGNAQQRLFWQVSGFLGALAEQTPLALLLDDIHWADSASLDLLQHLARHTRERPMLLVGTAREVEARSQYPLADALSDLSRDEIVHRLALRPLGAEDTAELIGATLGGADGAAGTATNVSADVAQRIYARSEGNAFFTRQLVRALAEQSALEFAEGQWRLGAAQTEIKTPESIRAVIGQRLRHLTPHTQEVLREASVLGQVFAFDELRAMSQRGEQEVEEALEEAVGAQIVREGERDQFHFNHALTLDTLADELPARRKRRLHRAATDAIEQAADQTQRAGELAYHLLAADEGERALPYALLAGDQAEAVYAHAEAEQHYRTALDLARELRDKAHEAVALEKLGTVAAVQGRNDRASDLLEQTLRAYQALGDQDAEMRTLGTLLEVRGSHGREALDELSARARAILERLEPSDGSSLTSRRASSLAALYGRIASICFMSGRYDDMIPAARRAADLARAAGDEAQLAYALHHLYIGRDLDDDPTALDTILALAERSGQMMIVVWEHNMIGERHAEAGEFTLALPHMEQSLAAAERRQDPFKLAWQLSNFSAFLLRCGDWQRAREVSARAEVIIREVDPHITTINAAGAMLWPGIFAFLEGHMDRGRRRIEESVVHIERIGAIFLLDTPTYLLAEADLLEGHANHVRQRILTYLHDTHPILAENHALGAHILLAWADGALGQYADAEVHITQVLAAAKPLLRTDALRTQGLLAIMQRDWRSAVTALNEAIAMCRAMPYPYAEAKALYVYGQLHADKGEPEQAREKYQAALLICDQLGEGLYRPHIEQALAGLAAAGRSHTTQKARDRSLLGPQ
jgi:transcriptional regulator with XRE-family HTH domain/tetratricopeptide (TPR) repeat protein